MFEIGNSLREARLRQGLDLARIEADTKIRVKYLESLEEERFEQLPAETYVKGFLRTYAEYLGLDGQLYVDEFNSRFATSEEPVVAKQRVRQSRQRTSESNFVVVALAGIVAVTVLVVVAWQFGTGGSSSSEALDLIGAQSTPVAAEDPTTIPEAPATAEAPAEAQAETQAATTASKADTVAVVLNAVRGDCWLSVHVGSADGELLFEGTLEQGQEPLRFTKQKLWIQVGAGENLDVKLNGSRVKDFPAGAVVVVITSKGVRTVSTA